MRILLSIFFLLTKGLLYSQDTTVKWLRVIDTSDFSIHTNKKDIPKEFYRYLYIEDIKKIANATDKYSPGCTNPIRGQFHWMAKQKSHWVISITYGGVGVSTRYVFFDKDKGSLNINEIEFELPMRGKTSFGQIASAINSRLFSFVEFDPDDYDDEADSQ